MYGLYELQPSVQAGPRVEPNEIRVELRMGE